jgi:hypothetical protein
MKIKGDLVISTSCRMELASNVADLFGQMALDVHVNILVANAKINLAAIELVSYSL